MHRLSSFLDSLNAVVGRAAAWLTLFMVLVTFTVVVLRYAFGIGFIWLQESVTFMHAAVFMLAAAWTLGRDDHVRVDVVYRRLSTHRRAWVDIAGTLLFLLPFCAFLLWTSLDYVQNSFAIREMSRESGGLRYPWPPLFKALMPAMALLLALQALALLGRAWLALRAPDQLPAADGHPGL